MDDETYNYIYDALCWAMDLMEDLQLVDSRYQDRYDKLNKAAGKLYEWYNNKTNKGV